MSHNGGDEDHDPLSASHSLQQMDLTTFLTGSEVGEVDVDDVFAKAWSTVIEEAARFDPQSLEAFGLCWATNADPRYQLQQVTGGIVLYAPDGTLAGGYIGTDLSLDPLHQGKGLGAEIVLARFTCSGDTPTWYLDSAAYSRAGLAAHTAAWRLGRQRPDLVRHMEAVMRDTAEPSAEILIPGP